MPRISRASRLAILAGASCSLASLSAHANQVEILPPLYYSIATDYFAPVTPDGSGGYYTKLAGIQSGKDQLPNRKIPLDYYIVEPLSAPGTSVTAGSVVSATAIRVQEQTPAGPRYTNETLTQVSGSATLVPVLKFGVYPEPAELYVIVSAQTDYWVEITPKPGIISPADVKGVPLIGTAKGSTQCSGDGEGQAGVSTPSLPTVTVAANCRGVSSFATTAYASFAVNVPFKVETWATGFFDLKGSDTGTFFATADPSFEIDPSFAYANDFELVYSPGLEPTPAGTGVPEPSSLLLLSVGAPLTLLLRRRARWLGGRLSILGEAPV